MARNITLALSILTVIGNLMIVAYILSLIFFRGKKPKYLKFLNKNVLIASFIITAFATLGSLYFSEVLHYDPCKLCWYQRILMYPQFLLLGIALWNKNSKYIKILVPLSFLGAIVAGLHYFSQISKTSVLGCSAIGYSASCSENFFLTFGYITIPMMALTAFLLLIMFWHNSRN